MRGSLYRRHFKRAFDFAASAAGLVVLSPVLLAVAAALKLMDPGPVFFSQTRVGLGSKRFRLLKFRSMRVGGGGPLITTGADARVTPLGRLLRKTKLDELPQLFNVLLGDMSFVGPRPEVPRYVELFKTDYELILTVKPGITDYAAIRYRDEEAVLAAFHDAEEGYVTKVLPDKIALYRRYIADVGFMTDLGIIVATASKVLRLPSNLDKNVASPRFPSALRPDMIRGMTTPNALSRRRTVVIALDAFAVMAAYALAFLLRFDFRLDAYYLHCLAATAPLAVMTYLLTSYYFGGLRYHAGFADAAEVVKAAFSAAVIQGAIIIPLTHARFPRSVLLLWPILSLCGVAGLHAIVRAARHYWRVGLPALGLRRTAVIVGVGDLGERVYQSMRADEAIDYRIAAFFDDDASNWGMRMHGARVVGGVPELAAFLRRVPVEEIVIAVGHGRGCVVRAVADALQGVEKRPEVRIAPNLDEMLKSQKRVDPRKVQPADLLNRRVVSLDTARIARSIAGKVVLVTGAGGTIGGELSRQVVRYKPAKVVLLENHATALFYREGELRDKLPGVEVVAVLGDLRDQRLLDRIFREQHPQIVFHAAAHKHVHQLEANVHEGVSNNLLGTYHLARAADRHGVENFILISTDKAVRPSCVMGATKRAAEIVVSNFAKASKTRFGTVRFGNVLGSSGSVLKIFQEQIEKGQPITITHPDAARYFMTVEEAVGLVLQASALAKGGEIFVLKMGEQIRVLDMARKLILLSGLEPERDIEIRFVGLKPGEKLTEELIEDASGQEQSEHPEIMVLRSENRPVEALAATIANLENLNNGSERAAMIRALSALVPTFTADPVHHALRAETLRPAPDQAPGAPAQRFPAAMNTPFIPPVPCAPDSSGGALPAGL